MTNRVVDLSAEAMIRALRFAADKSDSVEVRGICIDCADFMEKQEREIKRLRDDLALLQQRDCRPC